MEHGFLPIVTFGDAPEVASRDVPWIRKITPPVTVSMSDVTDVIIGVKLAVYSKESGTTVTSSSIAT